MGCPSRTIATSLLVVPRSMPMIGSMISVRSLILLSRIDLLDCDVNLDFFWSCSPSGAARDMIT